MAKADTLQQLKRKVKRDDRAILAGAEVQLMASELRRMLRSLEVLARSNARVQDTIRWWSLGVRCKHARAGRA